MKHSFRVFSLGVFVTLLAAAPAFGVDYFVPGAFTTIQSTLNVASSGDNIYVSAGVYSENIALKPGVKLIGAGPDVTIIDGGAIYATVSVPSGCGSSTRLEGFTIRNGKNLTGGGIRIQSGCSNIISNCIIENNHADVRGGGIYIDNMSDPTIEFCTIRGNTANEGGGIFSQTADPIIQWNVICSNYALILGGGVHIAFANGGTFTQNSLALNEVGMSNGSGLSITGSMMTVTNNIIALNTGGPGFWVQGSMLTADCNLCWGNVSSDYSGISPGPNDISADPQFCDPDNCDLQVSGTSPAVSSQECGLIGAQTVGCGFTATEKTSWGRIKSMYR